MLDRRERGRAVHAFENPPTSSRRSDTGPSRRWQRCPQRGSEQGDRAPVGCVRVGTTTAGTNSAVTKSGTGIGTVTLAGAPYDRVEGRIRITRAGTLGVGGFKYSLDGGRSESVEYVIPAGGAFAIPGTNITATFVPGAGPSYFAVDDTHSWTSTAPTYDTTALATAALDVVAADSRQWPVGHHGRGPPGGADDSAKATAAAALARCGGGEARRVRRAGHLPARDLEGPDVATTRTGSGARRDRARIDRRSSLRLCGGLLPRSVADQPAQMRVSRAWPYVARLAAIPFSQDPGDGSPGGLDGIIGESLETATAARSV